MFNMTWQYVDMILSIATSKVKVIADYIIDIWQISVQFFLKFDTYRIHCFCISFFANMNAFFNL